MWARFPSVPAASAGLNTFTVFGMCTSIWPSFKKPVPTANNVESMNAAHSVHARVQPESAELYLLPFSKEYKLYEGNPVGLKQQGTVVAFV